MIAASAAATYPFHFTPPPRWEPPQCLGMSLEARPAGPLRVKAVWPGSAAAKAGVRRDDELSALADRPLRTPFDLLTNPPGVSASRFRALHLVRDGKPLDVQIAVREEPLAQLAAPPPPGLPSGLFSPCRVPRCW